MSSRADGSSGVSGPARFPGAFDARSGPNRQRCGAYSHSLAAVAVTTELCVCDDDDDGDDDGGVTVHSKSAGPLFSNRQIHKACVPTATPESLTNSRMLPTPDEEQMFLQPLVCRRTFSEVAVPTPDQDNGYSSWEEEQSNGKFYSMKFLSEEQQVSETDVHVSSGNGSSQRNTAGNESVRYTENMQQTEKDSDLRDAEKNAEETSTPASPAAKDLPALPTPHCQNKAIAFIMGSPCSDESESEDDVYQKSDDEDDGFDSESSESEDSEDSDEEDEEDEDSETERLWSSFCQNGDPYNPRNFTAQLRTVSKPPSGSSVSESPPASISSGLSPPPSSPVLSESESQEACEMDEENMRLWNSFSCSADPYSLFNFQAPIRSQKPPKPCEKLTHRCWSAEAEERMDSGFSESSPARGAQMKKVQFVDAVEEFYVSSDEDRHGPWEEIARDRCRFQRRVQEVEETIGYCLSPAFRLVVFQRLHNTS